MSVSICLRNKCKRACSHPTRGHEGTPGPRLGQCLGSNGLDASGGHSNPRTQDGRACSPSGRGEGRLENSHPNLCTRNKGSHCLHGDVPASKGAGGGAVPSFPALLAPQQDNAAAFTIKMFEKLSGCWSALSWAALSGTWPLPTEQRRLPGGDLCWGDGDRARALGSPRPWPLPPPHLLALHAYAS